MADATALRRPLEFAGAAWLAPVPSLTRFVFRGDLSAREAAGRQFGVALPETACRSTIDPTSSRAALWLGPDEHLLLAPDGEGERVTRSLAAALSGHAHSLVDVSHRQVAFRVIGPRSEWLLESQCPLPLNERDYPVGMCTRTIYSKAEIVLWRTAARDFHVEVWRSFSAYVVGLLHEVATETDR